MTCSLRTRIVLAASTAPLALICTPAHAQVARVPVPGRIAPVTTPVASADLAITAVAERDGKVIVTVANRGRGPSSRAVLHVTDANGTVRDVGVISLAGGATTDIEAAATSEGALRFELEGNPATRIAAEGGVAAFVPAARQGRAAVMQRPLPGVPTATLNRAAAAAATSRTVAADTPAEAAGRPLPATSRVPDGRTAGAPQRDSASAPPRPMLPPSQIRPAAGQRVAAPSTGSAPAAASPAFPIPARTAAASDRPAIQAPASTIDGSRPRAATASAPATSAIGGGPQQNALGGLAKAPGLPDGAVQPQQAEMAFVQSMGGTKPYTGTVFKTPNLMQIAANGALAPTTFRCAQPSKSDKVDLQETAAQYVVTFTCIGGTANGLGTKNPKAPGSLAVAFAKGQRGIMGDRNGPGSRSSKPGQGRSSGAPVVTLAQRMDNCLKAFDVYKSGAATFDVVVAGHTPICSNTAQANVGPWIALSNASFQPAVPKAGAMPLSTMLMAENIEHFGAYIDGGLDGNKAWYPLKGTFYTRDIFTNTNSTLPLGFISADKPGFQNVRVQLLRDDGKPGVNAIALGKAAATGAAAVAGKAKKKASDFVLPALGDQCSSVLNPANLVGSFDATVVSQKYPVETFAITPKPEGAQAWLSRVNVTGAQMSQLSAGAQDGRYKLRMVPMASAANVCAGFASAPLDVDLGINPFHEQFAKGFAKTQAQWELAQALTGAVDKVIADAGGAAALSPVTFELVGWIPPGDHRGQLVMTEVSKYTINDYDGVGTGPIEPYSGRLMGPFQDTFSFDLAFSEDQPWPEDHRDNWFKGCAIDPYQLERAVWYDKQIDDPLDYIATFFNMYAALYSELQNGVVQAVAYGVTLGKCEPSYLGKKVKDSDACGAVKGVLRTALSSAMAAAGLPPSFPTSAQLAEKGAMYLASYAVDAAAGGVGTTIMQYVPEMTVEATKKYLAQQILEIAIGQTCAQPIDPTRPPKEQGYSGFNPATLCGIRGGAGNYIKRENYPTTAASAVAYLRLKRNQSSPAPSNPVTFHLSMAQGPLPPGDPMELLSKYVGPGYQPLRHMGTITLDPATIPPEGLIVPVTMTMDAERLKAAAASTPICINNQLVSCQTGYAHSSWRYNLSQSPSTLSVTSNFRFSENDVTACVPIYGTDEKVCGSAPATTWFTPVKRSFKPGRIVPGLDYGIIPKKTACPGMKHLPDVNEMTGLPEYRMDVTFDFEDEF